MNNKVHTHTHAPANHLKTHEVRSRVTALFALAHKWPVGVLKGLTPGPHRVNALYIFFYFSMSWIRISILLLHGFIFLLEFHLLLLLDAV